MKKIYLPNRYNDRVVLIPIDDNKFKLECTDHYRVGLIENSNDFSFVDPSGGPFISINSKWDFGIVKRIYSQDKDIIIEYDNEEISD